MDCDFPPFVFSGIKPNASPCFCRDTGCTKDSGLYCKIEEAECPAAAGCTSSFLTTCSSGPNCTNIDTTSENSVDCTCGTTACNDYNGKFCLREFNQCAHEVVEACPTTDGSAELLSEGQHASPRVCICGSMTCNSDNGLICYSDIGEGTCRKTGFGAFGYDTGVVSGRCDSMQNSPGRGYIRNRKGCEEAVLRLGFVPMFKVIAEKDYPPGCVFRDGFPSFNSISNGSLATQLQVPCGKKDVSCICMLSPNCAETNGTTENTAPCLCGTTVCTKHMDGENKEIGSGLFCQLSISHCSHTSVCSILDGSGANEVACNCGPAECECVARELHCCYWCCCCLLLFVVVCCCFLQ